MSPEAVRLMLRVLGAAFGIGEQLLTMALQRYPELRREDPGPLEDVERARAEALARAHGRSER